MILTTRRLTFPVSPYNATEATPPRLAVKLTGRELEELNLLSLGGTRNHIATDRGISRRAVDFHSNNMRKKFDLNSTQLIVCFLLFHNDAYRENFIKEMWRTLPEFHHVKDQPIKLSRSERFVSIVLFTGGSDNEIAELLDVSDRNIHFYMAKLRTKLQARNRIELMGRLLTVGKMTVPSNEEIQLAIEEYHAPLKAKGR